MNTAYYSWAKRQVAAEVSSDFALLRGLHTSLTSQFLRIMESLSESDRLNVWKSIVKRSHLEGAQLLGEGFDQNDRDVITRYHKARHSILATVEPRKLSGGRVVPNVFINAVGESLESRLKISPERRGGRLLRFKSHTKNGIVHTYLDGSSSNYQMCYWHDVHSSSGDVIRERCSVLEFFGISSQTFWDETVETELRPAIDSLTAAVVSFIALCETEWDADDGIKPSSRF